ncbi:MAG: StbB family protein [Methylobacter sp.]
MKIAVINYAGKVGKTTLSAHFLSPRMNNAPIFAVETFNETAEGLGVDVERIKGKNFIDLFQELGMIDDAIIDVGSSNIGDLLASMTKFGKKAHAEFDFFVVPVTKDNTIMIETIKTINILSGLGIPAEKIKLLFNRVEDDVEEEFEAMLNYVEMEKKCTANKDAAIYANELFDLLSKHKKSMDAIMTDESDYKAMAREIGKDGDKTLRSQYTEMYAIKALATSMSPQLDEVYTVLFG